MNSTLRIQLNNESNKEIADKNDFSNTPGKKSIRKFLLFLTLICVIIAIGFVIISQHQLIENLKSYNKIKTIKQFKVIDNQSDFIEKQKKSRILELTGYAMIELQNNPTLSFRLAEAALNLMPGFLAKKNIGILFDYPLHDTIDYSNSNVVKAIFSHNGKYIAQLLSNIKVKIFDTKTRAQIKSFEECASFANFSPNNTYLATGSNDNNIIIWHISSGNVFNYLKGHKGDVLNANFSNDSKKIVSVSNDKTSRVWDLKKGEEILLLNRDDKKLLTGLFSYDDSFIITITEDTYVLWDNVTGKKIYSAKGHKGKIYDFALSKDSKLALTVSSDKTAMIYHLKTGDLLHTLKGHDGFII